MIKGWFERTIHQRVLPAGVSLNTISTYTRKTDKAMEFDNKSLNLSSVKVEVKQISIGELQEMFSSGKIKVGSRSRANWGNDQKSHFIELLMMGIPMPSVYLYYNRALSCWINMGVNKRLETLLEYMQGEFQISSTNAMIDSSSGMTYQSLTFQDKVSLNSMYITVNFISGIYNTNELQVLSIINSHHS